MEILYDQSETVIIAMRKREASIIKKLLDYKVPKTIRHSKYLNSSEFNMAHHMVDEFKKLNLQTQNPELHEQI